MIDSTHISFSSKGLERFFRKNRILSTKLNISGLKYNMKDSMNIPIVLFILLLYVILCHCIISIESNL